MEKTVCSACGSNELSLHDGYFMCSYCRTKFKQEPADAAPMVIDQDGTIQSMLDRAERLWNMGNKGRAQSIYRQILEMDPANQTAISRYR